MEQKLNGWCPHGIPGAVGCEKCESAADRPLKQQPTEENKIIEHYDFWSTTRESFVITREEWQILRAAVLAKQATNIDYEKCINISDFIAWLADHYESELYQQLRRHFS